jgi:lipopolysaccharide/colanic/teichoic acid biosynthesis glycosyltransferase
MSTHEPRPASNPTGSKPDGADAATGANGRGPVLRDGRGPLGLLGIADFDWFLERERSLADRGDRCFTLLILKPKQGSAQSLEQLAVRMQVRLRRTDLIGFVEGGGLGVLLSDTRPAGSMVVASWVDDVLQDLRLDVDAKIFVYPSVDEAEEPRPPTPGGSGGDDERLGPSDGHSHGSGAGRVSDDSRPSRGQRGSENGGAPAGEHRPPAENGAGHDGHRPSAPDASWPMEDLWTKLSIPLPLWKRSLDIVLSVLILLLLSPLYLVIPVLIRLDSTGPAVFRQKRAGRGARPFTMYKFRSMVHHAERSQRALSSLNEQSGPVFKIRHDPRTTRVGRMLRRWSLDELPQVWNVLKGDISLVGPRSPTFDELAEYERWHRRRLNITGGMTCIWQVSGRSQVGFREWMRMDMDYVSRSGPWLDLKLLGRTLVAIVSGRGAY